MMSNKGTLKVCKDGHRYYKSTDCPTCPICEKARVPRAQFLSKISAPARRALEREQILTLDKLATYSRKDILSLHGVGPSTIPKLQLELKANGLDFSK